MADDSPAIAIQPIAAGRMLVPIVGTAPLIVHRFAEKAKATMLGAQQGKRAPKQVRDPLADYEAAFYYTKDGRYGFPSLAFKGATVSASRFFGKDVTLVGLRQALFFRGEPGKDGRQLSIIEGEPQMREDVVRLNRAGTDLRYRPEFSEWQTILDVTFVKSMVSQDSVLSLIDAGGLGVGVGEWRPEHNGDFGTYRIDETRDVEVLG